MTTRPPAVVVHGLRHRYGDRAALAGVSFRVGRGEIFGLLGPNGGGKTTTFRILSTLLPATPGAVSVFGADPGRRPDAVRRRIGVVFQSPSLDPKLTVTENLIHHGRLYGMAGALLKERIAASLDRFGVADRGRDRVETLSGGLARRVELAKGMLHEPDLLLLDEPSSGLDLAGQRDLWDRLLALREGGTTVLVTTHLMQEADRCDRLVLLSQGRVVAEGAPDALRAELAGEVVRVETADAAGLARDVREKLGWEVRTSEGMLRLETDDGAKAVARLMDSFGDRVEAVHLGKATLDDVFFARTGRSVGEDEEAAAPPSTPPEAAGETSGPDPAAAADAHPAPEEPVAGPVTWRAAATLAQRELVRFIRQGSRLIGALATPVLLWITIGSGLGESFRGYAGGEGYLEYFFPGMLALSVLFTSVFSTSRRSSPPSRSSGTAGRGSCRGCLPPPSGAPPSSSGTCWGARRSGSSRERPSWRSHHSPDSRRVRPGSSSPSPPWPLPPSP
jgi:ABC-2 type transport system ATP-binding protein